MPFDEKSIRIDQDVFQQTLEKKLADLPPLPAVVTRIMQTINDPNTSAEDLDKLIALDQGLSSKILRIVNSAYYGFPKRVSTITHAVVILGYNTVRNLVLGVSAFGMLSQKSLTSGLDRTKFWEHSVATALGSSMLAKKKTPKSRNVIEEAFLGGLLHDIGELFLDCYFPVQFSLTMAHAAREEISLIEAEETLLGIDHITVGKQIADRWNFPPSLMAALSGHLNPEVGDENFESAAVVHTADWLAWQIGMGSSNDLIAPTLSPDVEEWLAFSEEDLDWAKTELEKMFYAARDMLQVAHAA